MTPADPVLFAERVATILSIALHRFLDVALLDPAEPNVGIAFPVEDAAVNNLGLLHGGVVTALLDVACYLALLPGLGADEHAVTHDLAVSLIRAVPRGARVEVRGHVVRRGSRIVFLRAEATVEGTVVAVAQVTKSVVSC